MTTGIIPDDQYSWKSIKWIPYMEIADIYDKYIEAKEAEWNDYRAAVTQWEIDEYLYKF